MADDAISEPGVHWRTYADAAALASAAAGFIAAQAAGCCRDRGAFRIALAGGRTPGATYQQLRHAPLDWSEWHIYFGDERCLPAGDPQRNDAVVQSHWLQQVSVPPRQVHPIRAELGPEAGARDYADVLARFERLDLALLGLGEDGHTASLFPGHPLGADPGAAATLAVRGSPKPPPQRVSMSARYLSSARQVLVLVAGADKREAVARWRAGENLPIKHIRPAGGLTAMLTEDAWPA